VLYYSACHRELRGAQIQVGGEAPKAR